MSESFDLLGPTNFVAGTVGEPGEREFFLQATDDTTLVSLKVEKGQVQALASGISDVLGEQAEASPIRPSALVEPVISAWVVGSLGIGLDEDNERLVVLANEVVMVDESDEEPMGDPAIARVHLSYAQALGFVEHALFLVEYGRDFGRQNGHRPL